MQREGQDPAEIFKAVRAAMLKTRMAMGWKWASDLPTSMPSSEIRPVKAGPPGIGAAVIGRSVKPRTAEVKAQAYGRIPIE